MKIVDNKKDMIGKGASSKEAPIQTEQLKKEVKIDKALYKVIFERRWLNSEGKIVECGDIMNVDKQTFDILISHKIVKEIK